MPLNIIIREACESDLPSLVEYNLALAKETENLDLNKSTLTNRSSNKTYELKSLGEVIEIIEAGNIFEYARKTGMIPSA